MKCMMSVDRKHIRRVTDDKASMMYEEGWRYVSKSMWKEQVRDAGKTEESPTGKKKHNKMSKVLSDVDLTKVTETDDNTDLSGELACAGGNCEVV